MDIPPLRPKVEVGARFGQLVVQSRANEGVAGMAMWNCTCNCGRTCIVSSARLKSGKTTTCPDCVVPPLAKKTGRPKGGHNTKPAQGRPVTASAQYDGPIGDGCYRALPHRGYG